MKNLGDTVWLAWCSAHSCVSRECIICGGTGTLEIRGAGDPVTVHCERCHGRGKEQAREARCGATKAEVTGISKDYDDRIRYEFSPSVVEALGHFDTEEEALAVAEAALPEAKAHRERADASIAGSVRKSASWSVSYHRREIRRAKGSIAWHEAQLNAKRKT